ncbi:unnamed protein product [Trichobilharzia szidati]|nr:unnamed protein product [Trichobilharzia szidati]
MNARRSLTIELFLILHSYVFFYLCSHPPRLVFDVPSNDSNWLNDDFMFTTKPSVDFRAANDSTRIDLNKAGYGEPLPWDIVDWQLNNDGFEKLWSSQNSNVIPSISASIKATIDPTDILVDAVHNFHPNYRHYTQTQMDEDS